ncbi:MAG: lysylphosphatidylglycerol synthase transmembrane domain-containing protein [Clostridiales bacterium]
MKKELSAKKTILNIVIFLALVALTMYILLRGQDFGAILKAIKTASPFYLVLGSVLGFVFILSEAINLHTLLKTLDYRVSFFQSLKYAFTGFFFSSITPSATGGQPMQLYAMKKDDIELSHSSLILLLELACFQVVTLTFGVAAIIWTFTTVAQFPNYIKILGLIGIVFNFAVLSFLIFGIFSPKFANKILGFITVIINKLPILSDTKKEKAIKGFTEQIAEYHRCAKMIKANLTVLLKVIPVLFLQFLCQFSVPYMIYLALGQNTATFFEIIMLQALVYTATAFVPLPGSVGINEGIFLRVFRGIYAMGLTSTAMVLSRGISFYLCLIISGLALAAMEIHTLVKTSKVTPILQTRKNTK